MSQSNDSGLNLDHLEALMQYCGVTVRDTSYGIDIKAMNGNSIYLTNDLLLELARRAALANQPAPTVPAGALVATITGSDTVIGRESRGLQWAKGVKAFDFEPGTRLYAHQPAQEQASTTRVTETKRTQLEARGYKVVGYVMQNSVNELCTLAHGRVEWLGKPAPAAQQEPVAAPGAVKPELMRQAVATVVSRVGDHLRIGWLRPERCDVGTLLYCATEQAAQLDGGQEGSESNG